MKSLYKILNILVLAVIVCGALSWGIWGFFHVEILSIFFGPATSRIVYCIIGICGLYGVHLMVDYAKKEWGIR